MSYNLPKNFKPMLATAAKLDKIKFPVYASPKLDGIRCIVKDGEVYTRSLKPLPNLHARNILAKFSKHFPNWMFDGELLVPGAFKDQTSAFMSRDGDPIFNYYVFDIVVNEEFSNYFCSRVKRIEEIGNHTPVLNAVPQQLVYNQEELEGYQCEMVSSGYEGVMIRKPTSPYKFGRSTVNEGYLLKLKPFNDAEATVVGVEELMHNSNPTKVSPTGYVERSSCQEYLIPTNTLGALICDWNGVVFNIGTGFTAADRKLLWKERSQLIGRMIKFKYQSHGMKDKPRSPVFLGFRSELDL